VIYQFPFRSETLLKRTVSKCGASLKLAPQIAEEHDSASSIIAAVEAGRGVTVVGQIFTCWAGLRVKIHPLTPAPPAIVFGIAYPKASTRRDTELHRNYGMH
jgi:DNA-binding transcriptional LysR family regulator